LTSTYLDEVLALGLGDERLQLGGGECVDKTGLGDDQQQHLGAGEDGQLVSLFEERRDRVSMHKVYQLYDCFCFVISSDRV
jgi:hypothetical protein